MKDHDAQIINPLALDPTEDTNWTRLSTEMFHDLSPYFSNAKELHSLIKCKTHLWEYFVYTSIRNNKEKKELFDDIFRIIHSAKTSNLYLFTKILRETWQNIREAIQNYQDLYQIERKKEEIANRISVKICFHEIGIIIEECISPFLKQLSLFYLITTKEFPFDQDIQNISLGKTVETLSRNTLFHPLTHPTPLSISLNQLRNIASHGTYKIQSDNQKIVCHYGQKRKQSITVNFKDLVLSFQELITIYSIIKSANSFYTTDYSNTIEDLIEQTTVTQHTCVATISEILLVNGLIIKELYRSEKQVDITAVDPFARSTDEHRALLMQTLRFLSFMPNTRITFTIKLIDETISLAETNLSLLLQCGALP